MGDTRPGSSGEGQTSAIDAEGLRRRFGGLYDLVAAEVEGLAPRCLDWNSDRWEWSRWSIRRQLSHMASCAYGWLCTRWGDALYPNGLPEEYVALAAMTVEERVARNMALDLPGLLARLKHSIGLAVETLARTPAEGLQEQSIELRIEFPWDALARAHPSGITQDKRDTHRWRFTLEATLRHIYFEVVTHLYNIQRLEVAQGLATRVRVPFEGYWALEDWDRSEP